MIENLKKKKKAYNFAPLSQKVKMVSQQIQLLRKVDEWWWDVWRHSDTWASQNFSQQLFCILCSSDTHLTGSEVTLAIQDMLEYHSWIWMTESHNWMDWEWQKCLHSSSHRAASRMQGSASRRQIVPRQIWNKWAQPKPWKAALVQK